MHYAPLWDSANLSQLTSNARARAYIAYRGVRGGDLERARKKDKVTEKESACIERVYQDAVKLPLI